VRECDEEKNENENEYGGTEERTAGEAIRRMGGGGEHENERDKRAHWDD
jgi:hypothetical protein